MNTNQLCTNCGCTDPQKTYDGYWCKMCKNELEQPKPTEPEPTTEPTTVLGWLERLPNGYRERALEQYDPEFELRAKPTCIKYAIASFADWTRTNEKDVFWNDVYLHYDQGTPLPPLPI